MPENPRVSRQTRKESRRILPDQHFHRGNIAYKYRNMETMADAMADAADAVASGKEITELDQKDLEMGHKYLLQLHRSLHLKVWKKLEVNRKSRKPSTRPATPDQAGDR